MVEGIRVRMQETGGPEVLQVAPFEPQAPGPGQVRIRSHAIGLNFIDTYHRTGLYPVKLPFTPGVEVAGTVDAVGPETTGVAIGDRVGFLGAGTYASHVIAPAERVIALPESVSFETAAAILLKGLTAWMLLFEVRVARAGETALVWAPVGGVGSLLVPWAGSLGVRVIAVTSSDEKAARASALGAGAVIRRDHDVAESVRDLTGGRGVDVAFDSVGRASLDASLNSLARRGWWISYGNASGPADPVAPGRLGALGSLVMTRPSLFDFIARPEDLARGAAALFGAAEVGVVRADIGQTFGLTDVGDAHEAIERGDTIGATLILP